jgi:MinD superfamily P-loop ATPase
MTMTLSSNIVIPTLDYSLCQACRPCEAAAHCRFKAFLRIDPDEPPVIDVARCGGCGDCVPHCPYQALVAPHASM